jgi:hypothetical protein
VGDFVGPDFGGLTGEAQATFRFFNFGVFDGGLTLNVLSDFSFSSDRIGYPVFASIAGGIGFDLGVLQALQFGPRLDFGYGSDIANVIQLYGAFVSFGAHLVGWVSRWVGLYLDVDGMFPLERFAPNGVRVAGGFAFAWD